MKELYFFREMPRYITVGIVVWGIELAVFYALYYTALFGLILSNVIARSVSSLIGFFLHKNFTFSFDKRADITHIAKYTLLVMFNIPANTAILYILQNLFNNPLCKPMADTIIVICSFLFTKIFIFSKKHNNREQEWNL